METWCNIADLYLLLHSKMAYISIVDLTTRDTSNSVRLLLTKPKNPRVSGENREFVMNEWCVVIGCRASISYLHREMEGLTEITLWPDILYSIMKDIHYAVSWNRVIMGGLQLVIIMAYTELHR